MNIKVLACDVHIKIIQIIQSLHIITELIEEFTTSFDLVFESYHFITSLQ